MTILTADEVLRRVEEIRKVADDDERAHWMEDDLHREVLEAIASGDDLDAVNLAVAALCTSQIEFARWCA